VRLLDKTENVVLLRPFTYAYLVAELSHRVLVVFFNENKFEPLLVPCTITAQEVVALSAVKAQLDSLGISNAGLFLRNQQGLDQYFSPDDQPCDIFFVRDEKNQLSYQTGIGRLFVKNKALGADMRLKRQTLIIRGSGSFKMAAAEKKKLETLARAEAQRSLLIKQVEEKKKQERERDNARSRRDALQECEEKKTRNNNGDPLVMFEEYFDQSVEKQSTQSKSDNDVSDRKQPRSASVGQREQTNHDLSAVKVGSPASGRKLEKTESEHTESKSMENGKESNSKVKDTEKEENKEKSSSSSLDQDTSNDKEKSASTSSFDEALAEEETLRRVGSAAATRRSRLIQRRSHVGSIVEESVNDEKESGKKETKTDIEEPGLMVVEQPVRKAGQRERERAADEIKAAAAIARQSVKKHKSPPPVATGSAQAAAMLASGKSPTETEDGDTLPQRRSQLTKDSKWMRNKSPNNEKTEQPKSPETTEEPVPTTESRSDFFGAKPALAVPIPGQHYSQSNPLAVGRGSWKDQMEEDERLNALFDQSHQAPTDAGKNSIDELKEKANELEKIPVKAPKVPQKPMEVDLNRLFGRQSSSVSDGSPADDQALEVKSPALLRIVLQQSTQSDGSSASNLNKRMDFISLSGTLLRNHKGVWSLEPGSAFHTPMAEADNCEVITLPPHIRATFSLVTKQWNVKSTERPFVQQQQPAALSPLPPSPQHQPLGGQKTEAHSTRGQSTGNGILRSFGQPQFVTMEVDLTRKRAIVQAVEQAVGTIIQHFSVTRNAQEKEILGDDSKTVAIGHLVRGYLCSAIAGVLADGMKPFRMGGLKKNNLWHLVQGSVAKSGNTAMATAVRVIQDLKKHPHMMDDNVRYRTFICGALNHRFLESWLIELTKKTDFLEKYYSPDSLLCLSSGPASVIYNELLISVQPLSTLPFRLFSSFEAQQAALQRQPQPRQDGVEENEERQCSVGTSPVTVVASTDVEAQNAMNGASSSSREALVESLTQIQQRQVVEEAVKPEDAAEEQRTKKSGRLWGAIVAVTSSVSQATEDAKQSIQSYWSRLRTSTQMEVRALYDNSTDDADELQFSRGDVLAVEEKVNDDWLICRLGNCTGMVPTNYVEPV
jgi:hypothetical protein